MTGAPTVEQAALNNALWCASVVRSTGGTAHFGPSLWWSVEPPPRYYPRAVSLVRTLDEGAGQRLQRLAAGDAVKDSFAALEAPGFETLFEAVWYWRPASAPSTTAAAAAVGTEEELAAWVEGWGGGPAILVPALLEQPGVAVLALRDGAEPVPSAGCTLFTGAGLVGLSNLFGPLDRQRRLIEEAALRAGPLPLASYARDEECDALLAAGFRPLGPLRVLAKTQ